MRSIGKLFTAFGTLADSLLSLASVVDIAARGHRNGSGRPILNEAWIVYTCLFRPGFVAKPPEWQVGETGFACAAHRRWTAVRR